MSQAKRILEIIVSIAYCVVLLYCVIWAVRGLKEEVVRFRERLVRNRELREMRDATDRIHREFGPESKRKKPELD